LKSAINKIENNRRRYSNSINNIKKKMIYLGKSKNRIRELINEILSKKKQDRAMYKRN